MNYNDWSKTVPQAITGDPLWKMEAYRLALFVCDLGWQDATKLTGDRRTIDVASQLYRALGSIEIEQGFMSMPWDQQERAGAGTIRDMSSGKR